VYTKEALTIMDPQYTAIDYFITLLAFAFAIVGATLALVGF
jgi:hypothetical protein